MIQIDRERPFDSAAIETLLDTAFGPERFEKPSYSLRESNHPIAGLSHVVRLGGQLVGTVRFWPVQVCDLLGGASLDALLLGPLAVAPRLQGQGVGARLMHRALAAASAAGHNRVLLVGDRNYYAKFGFVPVLPRYITLPGGRDARRLLVRQPATVSSLPSVGKLVSPDSVLTPTMDTRLPDVA